MLCPPLTENQKTGHACRATYCAPDPSHPERGDYSIAICTYGMKTTNTSSLEVGIVACQKPAALCSYGCEFLMTNVSSVMDMFNDSSIDAGVTPYVQTRTAVGCIPGNFSGKNDEFPPNNTVIYPRNLFGSAAASDRLTTASSFFLPMIVAMVLLLKAFKA